MVHPTRASLAGYTLLGSSPVSWSLIEGTAPFITTVDMIPSQAHALVWNLSSGKNRGVDLTITAGGHSTTFEYLYVIGMLPGASPHVAKVMLADRRIWWRYWHVGPRRYNWRRNTGFKRLRDLATPDVVEDVQGDVWYAPWSLFQEKPGEGEPRIWRAREIVENVINIVSEEEKRWNGSGPRIYWDDDPSKSLPIENLLIDGPASQSIARALGNLPETSLYLDSKGNVHIYNKSSGQEVQAWKDAGSEKVGGGHVSFVGNSLTRPSKIHVLFTREVELRFDFEETDALADLGEFSGAIEAIKDGEQRRMKNVLQNPDFISDGGKPSGSWMSFDLALTEWNKLGVPGFGSLDYGHIRRGMVPFMDLWSGILRTGAADPDVDWAARINALVQNYRRTFLINQRWWSRILSVSASRVAIIDKETGSRAPAAIWSNFSRIGTQRSYFRNLRDNVDLSYAMNVRSYPDDAGFNIDFALRYPVKKFPQADARVTIRDADQGVVSVDFLADENAMYEMCLPSMIGIPPFDENGVPVNAGPAPDPMDRNRPFTFDAMSKAMCGSNFSKVPQLAPEHRCAIIISAIPAAWFSPPGADPKDAVGDHQLHRITIAPDDPSLKGLVSPAVAETMLNCGGPEMFVRVGAGVEVARVAWVDSKAKEIERIFGLADDNEPPDLDGLVINEGNNNDKGASLNQIALAVAASVYSGYVDHLQGAMTVNYSPGMSPVGWLEEVAHEISTTGDGSTRLDFPEKVEKIDLMAFLDPSTRAIIMKLARP